MNDVQSDSKLVAAAHARGQASFMGLEMLVAPGVLVPRAETEHLARCAIAVLADRIVPTSTVVDMCCGCGNLACAIARHVPGSRVWASDLSDAAVAIARRNATFHGVADRVQILEGDLFGAFAGAGLEGAVDVIVCNPPYISEARLRGDRAHLLEREPRIAFAAGAYGISIHQRVATDALAFLRPGGVLLFEVGLGQDRQVKRLVERTRGYDDITISDDAAGRGRVVVAHKRTS
jgi:release factor glutamine methyltransferase